MSLPPVQRSRLPLGTTEAKQHDYLSLGLSLRGSLPTMAVGSSALKGVRDIHGRFGGDRQVIGPSSTRMGNSASIAPRERAAVQARGLAATVRAAAALEAKGHYWRDET